MPPFEVVRDWMENGRITEYVRKNPEVDRIGLVSGSVSTVAAPFEPSTFDLRSCGMWRTAFATSTRAA